MFQECGLFLLRDRDGLNTEIVAWRMKASSLIFFVVFFISVVVPQLWPCNSHAALNIGADTSAVSGQEEMNAGTGPDESEFGDEEWDEDFEEEQMITIADPLEPLNRLIFNFNDRLYFWFIKPVARAYQGVLPERARVSISNFYDNIRAPIRFINCTLQGKVRPAAIVLSRFMVNSTVGVLGLFDPAEKWLDLKLQREDMGQTFGWYGLGHGFYLVLPFFGPSSLRDGVGFVGDLFLDPINYIGDLKWYAGVRLEEIVNDASLHMGVYEDIKRESLDPYLFIKNAYIQQRAKVVKK